MANGPPSPDMAPPPGSQGPEAAGQTLRPAGPPQESPAQLAAKAEATRAQEIQRKEGPDEALRKVAGQPSAESAATNAPLSADLGKPSYSAGEAGTATRQPPEAGETPPSDLLTKYAERIASGENPDRVLQGLAPALRGEVRRRADTMSSHDAVDNAPAGAELDQPVYATGEGGNGGPAPGVEEPEAPEAEAAVPDAPPTATEGGGAGAGEPPTPPETLTSPTPPEDQTPEGATTQKPRQRTEEVDEETDGDSNDSDSQKELNRARNEQRSAYREELRDADQDELGDMEETQRRIMKKHTTII